MSQDNTTKSYIRIDASGRDIAGSNILRKKKPVTGKWRELTAYQCCNNVVTQKLISTPASTALTVVNFSLLCGATVVSKLSVTATTTTLAQVVAVLNTNFSMYGVFTVVGLTITLDLIKSIGDAFCTGGTLSFVIN